MRSSKSFVTHELQQQAKAARELVLTSQVPFVATFYSIDERHATRWKDLPEHGAQGGLVQTHGVLDDGHPGGQGGGYQAVEDAGCVG